MAITVEAVYENGVLKPNHPLPFQEREKVELTIRTGVELQTAPRTKSRGYGLVPWTGSPEDLDFLIDDVANDPLEGP